VIEVTLTLPDKDVSEIEAAAQFVRVYVVDPAGDPVATIEISEEIEGLGRPNDLDVSVQRWCDGEIDVHIGRALHPYPEVKQRAAQAAASH
jgi:hypothetical protein